MDGNGHTLPASRRIDWAGVDVERLELNAERTVFSQGDTAASIFYIERGGVRLSVVSCSGREAVLAILESGDFFGEGCLVGLSRRLTSATTLGPTAMLVITQRELMRQLHSSSTFSDRFLANVLDRNLRTERDLTDQLFNGSEKRLARALLVLAHYSERDAGPRNIPRVSQETLAEMIGTTRPRVNFFMNRFRALGHIDYKGRSDVTVYDSLVSVLREP